MVGGTLLFGRTRDYASCAMRVAGLETGNKPEKILRRLRRRRRKTFVRVATSKNNTLLSRRDIYIQKYIYKYLYLYIYIYVHNRYENLSGTKTSIHVKDARQKTTF